MAYKINFKDSDCQYVEDYNAGKYGTKVKIYFCEGDGCCPKQYSGSVGAEMITADTIEELKLKLDRAVANRDKEIAKTLTDSKKEVKTKDADSEILTEEEVLDWCIRKRDPDKPRKMNEITKVLLDYGYSPNMNMTLDEIYSELGDFGQKAISDIINGSNKKVKDADYTKQEVIDAVMEAYGFNKKEANEWYKKASEGSKKAIVEGFKQNAKKSFYNDSKKEVKDGDSYGEWDYEINCEGNQWADGGFESEEEAEDEAIAKVNELLSRHFPADYAIDDFDIIIRNTETGESYLYDPYTDIRDSEKKSKDSKKKIKDEDSYDVLIYKYKDENEEHRREYYDADELEEAYSDKKADKDIEYVYHQRISYYDDEDEEVEEIKGYSAKDCNMATLTPGTVKLKRASKEFNQKDAKFKDASADEIIDLFHEAYAKGRTWDWLKNKLPSTFLNLKNKKWEEIFPIQADRTGYLKGVNITKPENLSTRYTEEIDKFTEAFENYMRQVEHLEDYGVRVDTYNYDTLSREIQDMIDTTDSKKQSLELEQASKSLKEAFREAKDKAYYIPNISIWSESQNYADLLNKGSYEEFKKYIANKINEGYRNRDYKEEQRKPIIYNNKGSFIRSDSKVGPLTPEAEAYIRRVMGETTTEEIESKRDLRSKRRQPYYYGSRVGGIKEFDKEIDDLKNLLRELKSEQKKEKRMDINVSNRKHGFYKYTGKGPFDYTGRYSSRNGGYEYDPGTQPTTVRIDVQGLEDLQYALAKVLNSGTVAEVEENLQEALATVKKLPRNNPKVAEIRARIKALLEKRANTPVKKVPLPDKKFVRDSLRKGLKDSLNSKELAEYIELCKKLNLNTLGDIQKFSKEHNNAKDQDLLEALRKEAKKLK